jgi:hypothetical protein
VAVAAQEPQVVVQLEQQELPDKDLLEEMGILVIPTVGVVAVAVPAVRAKVPAPGIKVMVARVFT